MFKITHSYVCSYLIWFVFPLYLLKSASQKWISSMAWRPFSVGELAVGCQEGICLWTMDNNINITRSTSQAIFLKRFVALV